MSPNKNAQVKTQASKLSTHRTAETLRTVADAILADPLFTGCPVAPADMKSQADALDGTEQELAALRHRIQYLLLVRKDEKAKADGTVRTVASFVQMISGGDPKIIERAKFHVRRTPAPIGPLGQPEQLRAAPTQKAGEAVVRWKKVPGGRSYQLERSDTDGGAKVWSRAETVTRAKCTATGLTGARVYFRVAAVGAAGPGPWSDVASCQPTQ